MIITLKIELWRGHHSTDFQEWNRVIELEEDTTLEDLHLIIQELIDFDNDHLYEFFVANNYRSREKIRYDDENGLVYEQTIGDLYPLKNHKKIFYMFDYGESWLFRIIKRNSKSKKKEPSVKYPVLVEGQGENPEQYPSYEEW